MNAFVSYRYKKKIDSNIWHESTPKQINKSIETLSKELIFLQHVIPTLAFMFIHFFFSSSENHFVNFEH